MQAEDSVTIMAWKVSPHRNRGLQGFTSLSIPQLRLTRLHLTSSLAITAHGSLVQLPISQSATISARGSLISLPISQSVTITADRSFTRSSSFAAHRKGNKATCPPGCNVASSARHKNSQVPPLMSLIVNLSRRLIALSTRPHVHSSHRLHNHFFPPSVPLCTINKYSR